MILLNIFTQIICFSLLLKTRSLLSVFEEDAGTLTEYTNQLLQAMQRVYGAQVIFLLWGFLLLLDVE